MEEKVRERAAQRARRTAEAWGQRRPGPYASRTPWGEVVLDRVAYRTDPETGVPFLEVWAGGQTVSGDPHFRVVSPPLLVQDPEGDVEVRGKRYREDPLAALAEAIGSNGGAQAPRRRGRGR